MKEAVVCIVERTMPRGDGGSRRGSPIFSEQLKENIITQSSLSDLLEIEVDHITNVVEMCRYLDMVLFLRQI